MINVGNCAFACLVILASFSGFGEERTIKSVSVSGFSRGRLRASHVAKLVAVGYSEKNFHREGHSEWTRSIPNTTVSIDFECIGSIEGDDLRVNGVTEVVLGQSAISAQQNLSKHVSVEKVGDYLLIGQGKVDGDSFHLYLWVINGKISGILLQR